MPWACFLVERINERIIPHPCDEPDCDGHDELRFDVARVDNGEILTRDVEFISGGLAVGAMWFQKYTTTDLPTGPRDYDGFTEDRLADLRARAIEHPDWYPAGVDPTTGLPNRRQSWMFEQEADVLCVQTPGGVWQIDSRASNCGLPYDYDHRCWVRHGDPPNITVDKDGKTCAAGAGSIQCGTYHGFLQGGALTDG